MAYSNYGYLLLGRIIERVSGLPYHEYVSRHVLAPLGITGMRLGRTALELRAPDEVTYHSSERGTTVLDDSGAQVRGPYGTFNLENMDAHGGWLASAVDLARFAASFDSPHGHPVLDERTISEMFTPPDNLGPEGYTLGTEYYASGWMVAVFGDGSRRTSHGVVVSGTGAQMMRRPDGTNWVLLLNRRPDDDGQAAMALIDGAIGAVSAWPAHDLFPRTSAF